jgi:hypothetical protein
MILFYDTDNIHKLGFLRALKVFGYGWAGFYSVIYVAFRAYA